MMQDHVADISVGIFRQTGAARRGVPVLAVFFGKQRHGSQGVEQSAGTVLIGVEFCSQRRCNERFIADAGKYPQFHAGMQSAGTPV